VEKIKPGEKRCRDNFVKYPFPQNVNSNYTKDYLKYKQYKQISMQEAFNLEKEHKIINPHKVDCQTVSKDKYKGFKV
jgi:hypothetical protein